MVRIASVYRLHVLDFFGTAGSGGVYNKALGQGVGLNWIQGGAPGDLGWQASLNTVAIGYRYGTTQSAGRTAMVLLEIPW